MELQFVVNGQSGLVRREELNGIAYRVMPVVSVKEGVLNKEFVASSEIAACLDQWNGRPVTVAHPKVGADFVTANDPGIASAYVVGQVFYNTFADGKQRGEIWVEETKAQRSEAGRELLTRIDAGLPIEVSTAYFRDFDPTPGQWNGIAYNGRAYNLRPDHLAILLHERGACSWEDGCGCPRVNVEEGESEEKMQVNILSKARKPDYSGTTNAPWEGPAISDYIAAMPEAIRPESPRVEEMSTEAKAWIAGHSLLGDPAADNARDLLFFPVVTPGGELSEGALSAVISGRGAAAQIPAEAKTSAQELARRLLNDEFGRELETNAEAGFLERFWDELGRKLGLIKAPESPPEETPEAPPDEHPEEEPETMEEKAMEDEKKKPPEHPAANCECETPAEVPIMNAMSDALKNALDAFGGEDVAIKALGEIKANAEAKRAALIADLKANGAFSDEMLNRMCDDALEMLSNTVKTADYSGKGGGPQVNRNDADLVSMSF